MNTKSKQNVSVTPRESSGRRMGRAAAAWLSAVALGVACSTSLSLGQGTGDGEEGTPTLEQIRMVMGKWIETQQIISKERKDWQQGKEILAGRLELVKKEIAKLEKEIKDAETRAADVQKKKDELMAENNGFKATGAQLTTAVTDMEVDIRRLYKALPEPIQTQAGVKTLYDRIPNDPAKTRVSAAERYQNVLGILNAVNKANSEITVSYETHTLANGKPSEVKAIYIGLAQGYYVSATGEGGISRPTADGWKWEPNKDVAADVLRTLEMIQGKQTAAFVPLPMRIQ